MLRVAQTKGAISNKEMELFLAPAPKDTQDEKVWIDWIKRRMEALQKVRPFGIWWAGFRRSITATDRQVLTTRTRQHLVRR